jgi:transcription elongation factor Elf1
MELKGGKFFKDGVEVPIEIGNREQIELLNKRAKLMEKGLPIDVQIHEVTSYTMTAKWTCPHCDKINVYSEQDTHEDEHDNLEIQTIVNYEVESCKYCGGEVEVSVEKGIKKWDNWKFYVKPL